MTGPKQEVSGVTDGAQGAPEPELALLCPDLTSQQLSAARDHLDAYAALLARWATHVNLVAESDLPHLWARHLRPALELRPLVRSLCHRRLLDVGSGAGLPGVPLAIALPTSRITLVESRRRRAHFLRQAVRHLDLVNVEVVADRVENWRPEAGVDLVVSRAVTRPGQLAALTRQCRAPHAFLLTTSGPRSTTQRHGTAVVWDRPPGPGRGTWTQLVRP